jgi:hypothetical protein
MPIEIPVFVLGRLLRFPRLSRTSLARRTVPLEMLFVTGLCGEATLMTTRSSDYRLMRADASRTWGWETSERKHTQ